MTEPEFISKQTTDSRRFYLNLNPAATDSLAVVCGGVERTQSDYLIDRSDFPFFGVELVVEGQGRLWLGDREFQLSRGTAFAYGPGIKHRIENADQSSMRKYFLDLVGSDAKQLIDQAGLLSGIPIQTGHLVELTDLWDSIDRQSRDLGSISLQICNLLCRALLLKFRQRRLTSDQKAPTGYRTYEFVRGYIEEHFMELRTVQQVAEHCGMSPMYISRLFKRYDSVGAYRFLMRLRMNHAADLLIRHNMLVGEVAEAMGFADQFQFSRAFKRVYGVSPTGLLARY
ncbi:AraC family transcriptional regulator [Roseiconus nitratireducens]|uniref:AraC family transcriptional regulator n=1 Tax=Roseiconus nitratireducens TaxID=2605748 RepID=A0A5M6CSS5_9BACT|nr:AraC family transcriptional regulator [Roseiconus nitratireducens]KAA5537996.1 AraC family transcriptional regulator [Roseiconus nitratireducens]